MRVYTSMLQSLSKETQQVAAGVVTVIVLVRVVYKCTVPLLRMQCSSNKNKAGDNHDEPSERR